MLFQRSRKIFIIWSIRDGFILSRFGKRWKLKLLLLLLQVLWRPAVLSLICVLQVLLHPGFAHLPSVSGFLDCFRQGIWEMEYLLPLLVVSLDLFLNGLRHTICLCLSFLPLLNSFFLLSLCHILL